MNTYTAKILSKYINKNELLAEIETDIETGKLPAVTGNLLIRYIMNLPESDASEIIKVAERQGKVLQEIEDALVPAAITLGTTFRRLAEIVKDAQNVET